MIDETTSIRLAYIKSLYLNAKSQYQKNSDIEISRSLISLDACLEAFFWLILDIKKPDKDLRKLNQYFDILNEIKNLGIMIDFNSIKELHKARNRIQHDGILLAKTQIDRYYKIANSTFQNVSYNVFGISWNIISLSILIKNKMIANLCKQAEECLEKRDHKNSIIFFVMALELAKKNRQQNQFGSGLLLDRFSLALSELPHDKALLDFIDKMMSEIEILKLGVDYMKWREYRILLGNMSPFSSLYSDESLNQSFQIQQNMNLFKSSNIQMEDWLTKNIPFIYETILSWQESLGNSAITLNFD